MGKGGTINDRSLLCTSSGSYQKGLGRLEIFNAVYFQYEHWYCVPLNIEDCVNNPIASTNVIPNCFHCLIFHDLIL